jgi:uncharacterized protein YbaR (Trm112 family)
MSIMTKMKIDDEILTLIRCPETLSRLHWADDLTLATVNNAIEAGRIVNQADESVTRKVTSGLVNEARSLLYPIQAGIVVLVVDQAIPLSFN